MSTRQYTTVKSLYRRHIQPLSTTEQLELIALMSRQLAQAVQAKPAPLSIMALHGLGKDLWQGLDAQVYVAELRQEWERE